MSRRCGWVWAGLAVAAVAVGLRVHNAFDYPLDKGFDAEPNWDYVALLLDGWTLPAPDAGWAMAHPPLYYGLAAGVGRVLGTRDKHTIVHGARLLGAGLGLLSAALAAALVRRADPGDPRRAFLAGSLVLFLPAHVYMSAMLSEEMVASALTSLAVVGVAWDLLEPSPRRGLARPALVGVVAGLALLTKLTGLLAVLAAAGTYLIDGMKRGETRLGLRRAAAVCVCGGLVGGWFYLRNWVDYGYFYPHGLDAHSVMFTMPPGFRGVSDYFRIPWATFADPNPLSPSLLHSVWGTTYATIWFDAHRHFLPTSGAEVNGAGQLLTVLGLLPTAAFVVGLAGGGVRAARRMHGPDVVLVLLVALTLAGYVVFTWRNPWYVTLKGSFLLGMCVPFGFYASEVLARWSRAGRGRGAAVWIALGALALLVVATFWHGSVFSKEDDPGFQWDPVETPWTP